LVRALYTHGRGKSSTRDFSFINKSSVRQNTLVPGSANFTLEKPIKLQNALTMIGAPKGDAFFAAKINGRPCIAFRFKRCPLHVIELIADFHISTEFRLQTKAHVDIDVAHSQPSTVAKLAWKIIWGNEHNYYDADQYIANWKRFRWIYTLSCQ